MTGDHETLVRAAMSIMAAEKGIREDSKREQHWNILHWRQRENYLARARSAIEAFKASFGV